MSQSKWHMITHNPPSPDTPPPWNPVRTEILCWRLPNLKFQCLDSCQFFIWEFVIHSHEEFPERSTNSILTNVTHPGNDEGSQVSPGYMLSGAPNGGLGLSPGVGTAGSLHTTSSGIGSQWRQFLLGMDSWACLISKSQRWWLLLVGMACPWQWQYILLSAPFTGPTLFSLLCHSFADSWVGTVKCHCELLPMTFW